MAVSAMGSGMGLDILAVEEPKVGGEVSMLDIIMMQHSFLTIAMLNKMVAEDWMMGILLSSQINMTFNNLIFLINRSSWNITSFIFLKLLKADI